MRNKEARTRDGWLACICEDDNLGARGHGDFVSASGISQRVAASEKGGFFAPCWSA
jgi:hypothetical protein